MLKAYIDNITWLKNEDSVQSNVFAHATEDENVGSDQVRGVVAHGRQSSLNYNTYISLEISGYMNIHSELSPYFQFGSTCSFSKRRPKCHSTQHLPR